MPDNLLAFGLRFFSLDELEQLDSVDDQLSPTLHHTGLTSEEQSWLEYQADASDQSWFEMVQRLSL